MMNIICLRFCVIIIIICVLSFFLFREEFKVHFPDQSLETSHPQSILRLLENASKTLISESFKIHKARAEVAPVYMPYVGFVYTRMFWSK